MEKVLKELVRQHGERLDLSNGNEYTLVCPNGVITVRSADEKSAEMAVTVFTAGKPYVFNTDIDVTEFIPQDAE